MIKELEIEFEKDDTFIRVEYSVKIDDQEIEFSGTLKPYHTGRDEEYEFEPGYFTDEASEKYYDDNWDKIEEQILDAFYMKKYKKGGIMKSRSRYNTGRSWTLDHNQHNKKESYEIPLNKRKSKSSSQKTTTSSSSSSSSTKRKRYTYIPNGEIESITTWNGKEIKGSELLDGAYAKGNVKYADGGMMAKGGKWKVSGKVYFEDGEEGTQAASMGGSSRISEIVMAETEISAIEKAIMNFELSMGVVVNYDDLYAELLVADGGMMAKGGMSEHGLQKGDEIIDTSYYDENTIIVSNDGKSSFVNLNKGERYAEGGEIEKITCPVCKGDGEIFDEDIEKYVVCFNCNGEGYVMEEFANGGMMAKGGNELLKNTIRNRSKKMEYDGESGYGGYVVTLSGNKTQISNYTDLTPYSAQATDTEVKVSFNAPNRTMIIFSSNVNQRFEDTKSFEKYGGIKYIFEPLTNELSEEILDKVKSLSDGDMMAKGGRTYQSKYANRGASWTLDHYQFNKKEGYEKPLAKRKRL